MTATRRRGDRCLILAGRTPQNLQHLGGARRASGDERGIGAVQPAPADHLGVRRPLRRQAITVVVGVPAQLHIPHEPILPRGGAAMPVLARIIHARRQPQRSGSPPTP
jgi:hypothetical protein